ncbi:MAG TPA: RluA family pseudouridine synthase [Erysipelothrix sp.]|nr:RluA family pseudouridine synthase [Erysipelothrix sp.]
MKIELNVEKEDTLLNYLYSADLPYSRSKIKSLLKHKCVSINAETTTQFDDPVYKGDTVVVIPHNRSLDTPLNIIYEDKDILVIDKPYGLLTVATRKKEDVTAYKLASAYVKKQNSLNKIFVVHRLDRDTSGVLMFAKNQRVQKEFQDNWNDNVIDRNYIAIVEGKMKEKEGTVESFLQENKTTHMYSTDTGLHAITHYKVIREMKENTVVSIRLDTGRKNQIRVHMSDLKHPIIGDRKYNASTNPLKRMGLHAYRLEIKNPNTNKTYKFEAPLPRNFVRFSRVTDHQLKHS